MFRIKATMLVLLVCLSTGCANWQETDTPAKIIEIRILTQLKGKAVVKNSSEGDAFIGAIIGHAITGGPIGAAAGAAIAAGESEEGGAAKEQETIIGCELYTIDDKGNASKFFFNQGNLLSECALSKPKDSITIRRFSRGSYTEYKAYFGIIN